MHYDTRRFIIVAFVVLVVGLFIFGSDMPGRRLVASFHDDALLMATRVNGPLTDRVGQPGDHLFDVFFVPEYSVPDTLRLKRVTFTFRGSALRPRTTLSGIQLVDNRNNQVWGSSKYQLFSCVVREGVCKIKVDLPSKADYDIRTNSEIGARLVFDSSQLRAGNLLIKIKGLTTEGDVDTTRVSVTYSGRVAEPPTPIPTPTPTPTPTVEPATLKAEVDASSPAPRQLVMGSRNNVLGVFKLTSLSATRPFQITSLFFNDDVSANGGTVATVKSSFVSLSLYRGNTRIAGPVNMRTQGSDRSYGFTFTFTNPLVVSQGTGPVTLTLRGDVASFNSGGATDKSVHAFNIGGFNAYGVNPSDRDNLNIQVSGNSHPVTVVRSKLTVTAATLGQKANRVRRANDDIALLTFRADLANDMAVKTINLKFQGNVVQPGFAVRLIDSNTGADWAGLTSQQCLAEGVKGCRVNFVFERPTIIAAGAAKSVKLRVDSLSFYDSPNTSDSLEVVIDSPGEFLEPSLVPFTVTALSYK